MTKKTRRLCAFGPTHKIVNQALLILRAPSKPSHTRKLRVLGTNPGTSKSLTKLTRFRAPFDDDKIVKHEAANCHVVGVGTNVEKVWRRHMGIGVADIAKSTALSSKIERHVFGSAFDCRGWLMVGTGGGGQGGERVVSSSSVCEVNVAFIKHGGQVVLGLQVDDGSALGSIHGDVSIAIIVRKNSLGRDFIFAHEEDGREFEFFNPLQCRAMGVLYGIGIISHCECRD